MKHLYKISLSIAAVAAVLLFSNASSGPGSAFNNGYTGAPFDGFTYCGTSCHGGGNFTPSVSIQLRDLSNNPVSSYVPGNSYLVHLDVATTTGLTANTRYGFQIVGVRTANTANAGTWGTFAPDYQTVPLNGRVYAEHTDRLTSGSINLPWTAPSPGVGSIIFYAAGNVVDFSMDPTGDNATINNFTIPQNNPTPVTWLYFRGKEAAGRVLLEWGTTAEQSSGQFILEKSNDGQSFTTLATVDALKDKEQEHHYSFVDNLPYNSSYYRIKHKEVSGEESVFRTVQVGIKTKTSVTTYIDGNDLVILLAAPNSMQAKADVYDLAGRKVISENVPVTEGANTIKLEKPSQQGIYIISLKSGGNEIYSVKILVGG